LQRMQAAILRQTFDRGDGLSRYGCDASDTRSHRCAIDQHRTRATLAFAAAILASGEFEIVAQHPKEHTVGIEFDPIVLLIDDQFHALILRLLVGQVTGLPIERRITKTTMDPVAPLNIALTYANDQHTDGAGAQLQRIYGIYAISRFLKLPYVHSPIKRIDYQGLTALENNSTFADAESQYNRIFDIPSDVELPEEHIVHEMRYAGRELIRQLQRTAQSTGEFHLVRILYPYPITDQDPEMYRHVPAISPFPRRSSESFRLAIHVRRGEHIALSSDRMLPNSYYVSCALRFTELFEKLQIPFISELYTELPSKAFVVTPQHHGIAGRIARSVLVDPRMSRIQDFDAIPNLVRYINGDPIETLARMATADGLIISRSSYSYVAAILNATGIVVYHPFWHSPLSDWLVSNESGIVSDTDLTERLKSWKQSRTNRM